MRKIIYPIAITLAIFLLISLVITRFGSRSYEIADSAIVLGAAAWDGVPSPVFQARIDHAIDLYEADKVHKLYFTGGSNSPDQLSEAETAMNYAISKGVDTQDISIETTSQTTMQNLQNISALIESDESVLLITDPLHEYRSIKMARSLNLDAYPSPTPHTRYISTKTRLPFLIRETYFMIVFWIFGI